jgi:hypothetical protein
LLYFLSFNEFLPTVRARRRTAGTCFSI